MKAWICKGALACVHLLLSSSSTTGTTILSLSQIDGDKMFTVPALKFMVAARLGEEAALVPGNRSEDNTRNSQRNTRVGRVVEVL